MIDADDADDLGLLANRTAQGVSLLHNLEQAARDIGLFLNVDKVEYTSFNRSIGLMSWVFGNGPGVWGSIPGRVIPKTKKKKIELGTALFSTQHYKVMIKSKVEQSRERSSAFPYTSV